MSFHSLTKARTYLIKFGLLLYLLGGKDVFPIANFTTGKEIIVCQTQRVERKMTAVLVLHDKYAFSLLLQKKSWILQSPCRCIDLLHYMHVCGFILLACVCACSHRAPLFFPFFLIPLNIFTPLTAVGARGEKSQRNLKWNSLFYHFQMCNGGQRVSYAHAPATIGTAALLTSRKMGFYDLKIVIHSMFLTTLKDSNAHSISKQGISNPQYFCLWCYFIFLEPHMKILR